MLQRTLDGHDRDILAIAVPALWASSAEPLYLLADAVIIGRLGTAQLAGFGLASTLLLNAVYLCIFLAFATTASVARRLGAGELRAALVLGMDALWLALALGVLLAAAGLVAAPSLVQLFGISADAAPYAITYLRVSVLGLPAMLLVLAATGALRGLQDARTPMRAALWSAAANAGLNVLLVLALGLGVAGAAIGTVLAQWGAASWLVHRFLRLAGDASIPRRPSWLAVHLTMAAGTPLLVRTVTLRIAFLAMVFVASSQGDSALASHQVAFTLWSLLAVPSEALGIAGQALVGRHLGAGDVATARSVARRMIIWGALVGVVVAVLVAAARPVYIPAFTSDPAVRALLGVVLLVVAALQPVGNVVFVLDGVLIGAGDGRYLAMAGVWTLLTFLPLALIVLLAGAGLPWLWWAVGGFLLARLVASVLRYRSQACMVPGAAR